MENEMDGISDIKNKLVTVEGGIKKRGRKKKDRAVPRTKEDQTKFYVELEGQLEDLELVKKLLREANHKNYGREIIFKDLAIMAIRKLTSKDIEKLKDSSLSEMEKIQRLLDEHNQKMGTTISLGEFLVKRLNIE